MLPVTLASDRGTHVDLLAKLDTGSTYCVFQRSYAALLELDLTSGEPLRIATATGTFRAYGHAVTISVSDLEWEALVYFAEPEAFSSDVLGDSASWIDCA